MVETACVWLGFKQLLVKAVCMFLMSLRKPLYASYPTIKPFTESQILFFLLFYSLSGSPTVPLNPAVPGDFISHGHCNEILVPPVAQTCGLLLVIIMAVGWATHWWVTASTALYTVAWRVPPPLGRYSWTWHQWGVRRMDSPYAYIRIQLWSTLSYLWRFVLSFSHSIGFSKV